MGGDKPIKRALSKIRFLSVGVLALVATICIFPATSKADAIVSYGGSQYDLSATGYFSFHNENSQYGLEETPWWGDSTLAQNLAIACGPCLDPDGGGYPGFAYDTIVYQNNLWVDYWQFAYGADDSSSVTQHMIYTTTPLTWVYGDAVAPTPVPEPGSLSMILAGLLGLGLLGGAYATGESIW